MFKAVTIPKILHVQIAKSYQSFLLKLFSGVGPKALGSKAIFCLPISHQQHRTGTLIKIDGPYLLNIREINEIFETINQLVFKKNQVKLFLDFGEIKYISWKAAKKLVDLKFLTASQGGFLAICRPAKNIQELFHAIPKLRDVKQEINYDPASNY